MKSNIDVSIQGVKGGNYQQHKNKGAVIVKIDCVYLGNYNTITVDAFSGRGETYKRAENSLIHIETNEKTLFNGTFEELIVKLQK